MEIPQAKWMIAEGVPLFFWWNSMVKSIFVQHMEDNQRGHEANLTFKEMACSFTCLKKCISPAFHHSYHSSRGPQKFLKPAFHHSSRGPQKSQKPRFLCSSPIFWHFWVPFLKMGRHRMSGSAFLNQGPVVSWKRWPCGHQVG